MATPIYASGDVRIDTTTARFAAAEFRIADILLATQKAEFLLRFDRRRMKLFFGAVAGIVAAWYALEAVGVSEELTIGGVTATAAGFGNSMRKQWRKYSLTIHTAEAATIVFSSEDETEVGRMKIAVDRAIMGQPYAGPSMSAGFVPPTAPAEEAA